MKLRLSSVVIFCLFGHIISFSQQTIGLDNMFISLVRATNHSQKADTYYDISRYYADRLKVDSAVFYSEKILEESKAGNYEKGMGKHYLAKSYALYLRFGGSIPELTKAADIFVRNNDNWFSGYTYRQLGRQYERTDEYEKSRENYRHAVTYLLKTDDVINIQWLYHEIGKNFQKTYEPDSAVYYLLIALKWADKIKRQRSIAFTSYLLSEVYLESGSLDQAIKYAKYAYDNRSAMSRIELRMHLIVYARCLLLKNEFEKASTVIKEYETINGKMNDGWGNANLRLLKGMYQYHTGNYKEALTDLREAYDKKSEMGDFGYDLKNVYTYLAKAEYQSGLYDDALRHFGEVSELSKDLQFGGELLSSTMMISRCYEKKGNTDSAYRYLLVYDHIKDSIMEFRKEKTIIELTARYESEKKEQQISLLEQEKTLSAYQLRSKIDEIEKQHLLDARKTQQLALLSQQNEISRLESSEKTLAFENQQKEMTKKQNELVLLAKESELQTTIAAKEAQQKKFAYLAIAAVLLFSGYVVYRYTQNRKLSNRLEISLVELKQAQEQLIKTEKEKEAENVRVRISRDIHDEVGATLSGVALFSEIAREKMKQHKEEDAQIYLEHITTNSKEMVDKMSDIVWAINPDNDNFDRIIAKLQSYAFNLCAGKGISFHVTFDDAIREHFPPMQVKRNLYLFIKEAINNAVKYSEGKNLFLSLQKNEDEFIAEVRDDGRGFDNSLYHDGNGIKNMKARADILEGKFDIDSQKNKGTTVRLRFHFHPAGGHLWDA